MEFFGVSPKELRETLGKVLYDQAGEYYSTEHFVSLVRRIDAVVRILLPTEELKNGSLRDAHGTAFLVAERLIISNHHVLPDKPTCLKSKVQFLHDGSENEFSLDLDPESFFYTCPPFISGEKKGEIIPLNGECQALSSMAKEEEDHKVQLDDDHLDFTLVAIKPPSKKEEIRKLGKIQKFYFNIEDLPTDLGKYANVIQHPLELGQSHKKIAFRENGIIPSDDKHRLHYLSKALKGSSGSPVVNDFAQLLAMHGSACPVREKDPAHRYCRTGIFMQKIVDKLHKKGERNQTVFEEIKAWIKKNNAILKFTQETFYQTALNQLQKADGAFKKLESNVSSYKDYIQAFEAMKRALDSLKRACNSSINQETREKLELEQSLLNWRWQVSLLCRALFLFEPSPDEYRFFEIYHVFNDPGYDQEDKDKIFNFLMESVNIINGSEENDLKLDTYLCKAIIYEILGKIPEAIKSYFTLFQFLKNQDSSEKYQDNALLSARTLEKQNHTIINKKVQLIMDSFDLILRRMNLSSRANTSCYILHDNQQGTINWIEKYLCGHLKKLGIGAIFEKQDYTTKKVDQFNWLLVICTEKFKNFEPLNQIESNKIFYIKRQTEIHSYFSDKPLFDCCPENSTLYHSEANYLQNILSVFALMLGVSQDPYIETFQKTIKMIKEHPVEDLQPCDAQKFLTYENELPILQQEKKQIDEKIKEDKSAWEREKAKELKKEEKKYSKRLNLLKS